MENYKNIDILGINRLEANSTFTPKNSFSLNGEWGFYFANNKFELNEKNIYDYSKQYVPSCWQLNGYGTPNYINLDYPYPVEPPYIPDENPIGVYRKTFNIKKIEDKKTIIHFAGVNSAFTLYINEKEVGYSQCSRMPSEFDISSYINKGENTLVARVYKWNVASYLEDQDCFRHSGITRDVYMYTLNNNHILDFYVNSSLDDNYINGTLDILVKSNNKQSLIKYLLYDNNNLVFESFLKNGKGSYVIPKPFQWNAENPYLYTSVIELYEDNNIIDRRESKTGFKRVDIKDEVFYFNNKAIKLKGVNHHDTHPIRGFAINNKDMEEDIILMKQHNVNCVRTSHYPPHPYFLDLCDIYGLYVIDEADLETHGFRYDDPTYDVSDKPEWAPHFIDRAKRMVLRDRNHPSIIMWSLGNEARYGKNHLLMIDEIKKHEKSLPIHFEQAHYDKAVDMISTMYPSIEDIIINAKDKKDKRPYFLCEYAHSMGNAPGNLADYWELFYKYPKLMGGCIWEWMDHSVRTTDSNGVEYDAYGGDFGDYPNGNNFCMDGLLFSDKKPHTSLLQLKKVIEPAKVIEIDKTNNTFVIWNTNSFISLDNLTCILTLFEEGIKKDKKIIDILNINANDKKTFKIPFIISNDCESYVNIAFKLKGDNIYAKKGYSVCSSQIVYEKLKPLKIIESSNKIEIIEKNRYLHLEGNKFSVIFDLLKGTLSEYKYNNKDYITSPIIANFYRAGTDNDRGKQSMKEKWKTLGLDRLESRIQSFNYKVNKDHVLVESSLVYCAKALKPAFNVVFKYMIFNCGQILLKINYSPVFIDAYIPRIGIEFKMDKSFSSFSWNGLGPDENYVDKKEYTELGIYSKNIKDLFEYYEFPQETGNRSEIRWGTIHNDTNSLKVSGDIPLNMSMSYYTTKEIDDRVHKKDLKENDELNVYIDYAQTGLGNNSCGEETLEQYRLYPKETSFTILIEAE